MQEFNKGVYDYIIASDESIKKAEVDSDESDDEEAADTDCESYLRLLGSLG